MTAGAGKSTALKMCLACNREFSDNLMSCPDDGTTLISLKSHDDWIGETLSGIYQVTELIGKGGMGVVYLGRHARMDRLVAIKMLQAELAQDDASVRRFEQEAKAASCLNHPNLITLHDFGITTTGQPFLVMEYLEGRSLLEVIKLDGPVAPARACKIFSQAAEGLSHAHHQGIVHRDLKPSNILLLGRNGDSDFVKVVDFGLAKLMPWSGKESQHLTKTGEVFGSPIYMSPEQCMGRELRPTSDIYSLCITLYEALIGKPPFRGPTSIQTASLHMHAAPPKFDEVRKDLCLPRSLEAVVMKGLQKDPKDRFQTMKEFGDALQSSLNTVSQSIITTSSSIKAVQVDSTSTIPAFKAEQDKLRTTKGGCEPPLKAPVKTIAAISASCLLLGSAGGAAFWFTHRPIKAVSGILYYVDARNDRRRVEINQDPSHTTKAFALSAEAVSAMKDQQLGSSTQDSGLGRQIEGKLDPASQQFQSLTILSKGDAQVQTACDALARLLERACRDELGASEIQNDNIHLQHVFESDAPITLYNPLHPVDDAPRNRSAAALKVHGVSNGTTLILVDPRFYLKNQRAYWLFTIDKDGNVTSLEAASQQMWEGGV